MKPLKTKVSITLDENVIEIIRQMAERMTEISVNILIWF